MTNKTKALATEIHAALVENVRAMYADEIAFDDFRAKNRGIWGRASAAGVDGHVSALLRGERL